MAGFFREIVEEHKQSFDPSNIRDVVDSYLLEIETAKAEGREESLFEGKDPGKSLHSLLQIFRFLHINVIASKRIISLYHRKQKYKIFSYWHLHSKSSHYVFNLHDLH